MARDKANGIYKPRANMISNNGQSNTGNSNSKLKKLETIYLFMVTITDESIDLSI